jgi:hypothetical protein
VSFPWHKVALAVLLVLGISGCSTLQLSKPDVREEYESQKRIVRQGWTWVPVPEGEWAAVFFGYDRNRDYRARPPRPQGRGVDLLEYKRLLPDGHWEFQAFLILLDVDFDGYVDWVYLDHDRDASFDAVYAPAPGAIHFDRIDFHQFQPFKDPLLPE